MQLPQSINSAEELLELVRSYNDFEHQIDFSSLERIEKLDPEEESRQAVEDLVLNFQSLVRAIKGGNTNLSKYSQLKKLLATKVQMSAEQLKIAVSTVIEENAEQGYNIAERFDRLADYLDELNNLKANFEISDAN